MRMETDLQKSFFFSFPMFSKLYIHITALTHANTHRQEHCPFYFSAFEQTSIF